MINLETMTKEDISIFLKVDIKTINSLIWIKKVKGIYKLNRYEYLVDKQELLESIKSKATKTTHKI